MSGLWCLKKIFSNQLGAGLVLVLMVCSLVGAAAVYLMNISKNTDKKLSGDARVRSYYTLVQSVKNSLYNGNTCSVALGGQALTAPGQTAFSKEGVSIQLDLKLPQNNKILKKAAGNDIWFLQGGTVIKDVRLHIYQKVRAPVRLIAGTKLMNGALGYIVIEPGHPGVGTKLLRNREQVRIPLFFYYTQAGGSYTIDYCGPPDGGAYFCTIFGGAYDKDATTELRRCNPDRTCMSLNTPSGGITPNPGDCTAPYSAYPIGFIAGAQRYICEWCNPKMPLPNPHAEGFLFVPYEPHIHETQADPEWLDHDPQVPIQE